MKSNECPNCGASLNKNEARCKYCGSNNPEYVKPASSIFNRNSEEEPKKTELMPAKEMNWPLFILLFIFCFPAAFIYFFIKIATWSNKHK